MIKVVARLNFTSEGLEKLMPVIEELVAATVQEEGCVSYNFCKNVEVADAYAINETWESMAALDAHLNSEHFIRLVPQLRAEALGERDTSLYEVVL